MESMERIQPQAISSPRFLRTTTKFSLPLEPFSGQFIHAIPAADERVAYGHQTGTSQLLVCRARGVVQGNIAMTLDMQPK
jgi:hypothetical protein